MILVAMGKKQSILTVYGLMLRFLEKMKNNLMKKASSLFEIWKKDVGILRVKFWYFFSDTIDK